MCDFSVNLQMILVLFSGCAGSSLLHGLSLAVQMGAALAAVPGLLVAGHGIGGMQASVAVAAGLGAQAQQLWRPGLAAPRHVGSSWIRDPTCVSCTGTWVLYH